MSYKMIKYAKAHAIATITLNRPEKYNTLRLELIREMDDALRDANQDKNIKVIILEGSGDAFCGGFDFSGGLEHYEDIVSENYDPGIDYHMVTNQYTSYIPAFMGLWRGLKTTICKVHGYAVGGGSELALSADLVVASDCAQIGTPYSRVWGCHLTGMWIYRLPLAKAKYHALTGEPLSGKDAAACDLINFSYPLEKLDQEVMKLAKKLTRIPLTQLFAMKLIVNQAYDNMGLQSTQTLGPILDGAMRNNKEGLEFVREAREYGVRHVVDKRDAPWGDYSHAPKERQPGKKSELSPS